MKSKWTPLALSDFDKSIEYIAINYPTAARKVAKVIYNSVHKLSDHPEIGRPGRIPGTREMIIKTIPYLIPYRVRDNTIHILRVLHTSRTYQ